jgi:hypothetical protein
MSFETIVEHKNGRKIIHEIMESDNSGSFWHNGHFDKNYFDGTYFYTGEIVDWSGSGKWYSIENLGVKNRVFEIKGLLNGLYSTDLSIGRNILRNLIGQSGSLSNEYIPETSVFFENVSFEDNESDILQTKFNLNTIEIIN